MSTVTLAFSCLTTSNLPWFMDLTFQVPMQYCSLQHWTLLLSPVTSTIGYCFCFGSIPSFFLELFLHWSPVAYWAPTDPGSSSFSILSYCSWGFQGKNTEVVCHSLLQWATFCQNSPSWPVCLGWPYMAWLSFTELEKAVVRVIRLTSFLWFCFCVSALWCPLATLTVLLGFLLRWTWGISLIRVAKGPYSRGYGLPSGHVRVWELDRKKGRASTNWWLRTVVQKKTSEISLDSKEIKPVNFKGNQPWILIGRTDAEAEAPVFWSSDANN